MCGCVCQELLLGVRGTQAPAEENEASPRDNDESVNDDVFHVSIIPSLGVNVKSYFFSL